MANAKTKQGNRTSKGFEYQYATLCVLLEQTNEDSALSAQDISDELEKAFGLSISKQTIESYLKSFCAWESDQGPLDTTGATALGIRIEQTTKNRSNAYYVSERSFSDFEIDSLIQVVTASPVWIAGSVDGANRLIKKLNGLRGQSKKRDSEASKKNDSDAEPPTRKAKPSLRESPARKGMPPLNETLDLIQEAIDRQVPISAKYEQYHVVKSGDFPIKPKSSSSRVETSLKGGIGRTGRDKTGNDQIEHGWPYAIRFIDGRFYVMVSAKNRPKKKDLDARKASRYRICRADLLRDIELIELKPGDQPAKRPSESEIDEYFDGAVFDGAVGDYAMVGTAHEKKKEKVTLIVRSDSLPEAFDRFETFDGFSVYKDDRDKEMDENYPRNGSEWFTVCFEAHPVGVVRWAEKYISTVKFLEPKWAQRRLLNDLKHNVYGNFTEEKIIEPRAQDQDTNEVPARKI